MKVLLPPSVWVPVPVLVRLRTALPLAITPLKEPLPLLAPIVTVAAAASATNVPPPPTPLLRASKVSEPQASLAVDPLSMLTLAVSGIIKST